MADRRSVLTRLKSLLPAQLEELIFVLGAEGLLAGPEPNRKAMDLVRYAEQKDPTLESLSHEIDHLVASSRQESGLQPGRQKPSLALDALRKACRNLVAREIYAHVGSKYLPSLCQPRPIENDIVNFLNTDLDHEPQLALAAFFGRMARSPQDVAWAETVEELRTCPSAEADAIISRLLAQLPEKKRAAVEQSADQIRSCRRLCFLVRDKAGSGKTNLLCQLATRGQSQHRLILFLTGRALVLRGQTLQDMILRSLQEELVGAGVFSPAELTASQFLATLATTLTAAGAELILLVDGINEHRDLALVDDCILGLLRQWNRLPIKLVVTCRDIFWSFFSEERWHPFLFRNQIFELPSFAPERMEELISAYFEAFQITGQLLGSAREKCRHPLLLRFFCESHRGSKVHAVLDLRLKDLFDEYWQRKRQDIAQSIGPETGTIAVEEFLLKIVNHMATAEVTNVPLSEVRRITAESDVESNRSIYKRLLDQDIIIEELPPEQAMDRSYTARRISFVYDEFFDYMMALAHVRRAGWDALDPRQIRDDFARLVRDSKRFEQLRGVAEYLVLIAEQRQLQKVLCTELASQGVYEVLCNVLPKLRGERSWMLEPLEMCLQEAEKRDLGTRTRAVISPEAPGPPFSIPGYIQPESEMHSLGGPARAVMPPEVPGPPSSVPEFMQPESEKHSLGAPARAAMPPEVPAPSSSVPEHIQREYVLLPASETESIRVLDFGLGHLLATRPLPHSDCKKAKKPLLPGRPRRQGNEVTESIVQTVLTLWKDAPAQIWTIATRWGSTLGTLAEASGFLIAAAIETNTITGRDAQERLRAWLLPPAQKDPVDHLSTVSGEPAVIETEELGVHVAATLLYWLEASDLALLDADSSYDPWTRKKPWVGKKLSGALRQLYFLDAEFMLKTLSQLFPAVVPSQVLADALTDLDVPQGTVAQYDRLLSILLSLSQFPLEGSRQVRVQIRRLIQRIQARRSVLLSKVQIQRLKRSQR